MQRKGDESRAQQQDDERETLLINQFRRGNGTEAGVIIGQSTLPQTIFNSSNVLIGVGLISPPLAIRYAGWVIGLIGLWASAMVAKFTAGLLAKCLGVDSSLANFGDVAFVAFGEKGRIATSMIITLELVMTCVGLVILFADTLQSAIDGYNELVWKLICGIILAPLNFIPLPWLDYSSFLGIFCSIAIIVVAVVIGLLKPETPGSLREVAITHAFSENWRALPLSFGLIMALWTGRSVFLNIYRNMRHPGKYVVGLKYVSVDIAIAVHGYLLYGKTALDEFTTNIIMTKGYPGAVKIIVLVEIATVPFTKFPLQCAPIVSTLEVFSGIDGRARMLKPKRFNQSRFLTRVLQIFFRSSVTILTIAIAIATPSFELISAIMGGPFGYLFCVIIPVLVHSTMFQGQMKRRQITIDWVLIVVAAILGVVGTVWEFLASREG